jgi:hypothetical protein
MERIGVALRRPRGPTNRRDEYGIYAMTEAYGRPVDPPKLYLKYEGYREQRADGEAQVGLPLAGPGAAHLQPLIDFHPNSQDRIFGPDSYTVPTWETIRYFKDGPWNAVR